MPGLSDISKYFKELKRKTEQGFYAPVTDATLENNKDTLVLTLDYPDSGVTGEYKLSVPQYWEGGRELVEFLSNVGLGAESFERITNRALPVKRVSGSWQVDSTRLKNGDYKVISAITTFSVTDTTQNNVVSFDVEYDVEKKSSFDHLELVYNNQSNDWADDKFTLSGFSGTHSGYSAGGATGQYNITLNVYDTNGNVVESETKTITAG